MWPSPWAHGCFLLIEVWAYGAIRGSGLYGLKGQRFGMDPNAMKRSVYKGGRVSMRPSSSAVLQAKVRRGR
jgi:hypothetical protein